MVKCPECAFTYGERSRAEATAGLRAGGNAMAQILRSGSPTLRIRPAPEVWSPVGYGCHMRDVALMQRDRLYVALVEDEPSFKPMYRDHRVAFDRYDEQEPGVVADQLDMVIELFAHALEGLDANQWLRPLVYEFPHPTVRTVEWMAHHTLHEVVHHLSDMERLVSA